MELIKPSEVSSKILTLLDESDEKVIIVSPYCKFSKWYKLTRKIKELKNRNISIEFYIRDGSDNINSRKEVEKINIDPILIKDLHCKIYLNEKYGIVSSMNLLLSSEINSLEIAYKTETDVEYNELLNFHTRYISLNKVNSKEHNTVKIPNGMDWKDFVCYEIGDQSGRNAYHKFYRGEINIKTSINNYYIGIFNNGEDFLQISGILSYKELEYAKGFHQRLEEESGSIIEFEEGEDNHYSFIFGIMPKLKSNRIYNIDSSELDDIASYIINFI